MTSTEPPTKLTRDQLQNLLTQIEALLVPAEISYIPLRAAVAGSVYIPKLGSFDGGDIVWCVDDCISTRTAHLRMSFDGKTCEFYRQGGCWGVNEFRFQFCQKTMETLKNIPDGPVPLGTISGRLTTVPLQYYEKSLLAAIDTATPASLPFAPDATNVFAKLDGELDIGDNEMVIGPTGCVFGPNAVNVYGGVVFRFSPDVWKTLVLVPSGASDTKQFITHALQQKREDIYAPLRDAMRNTILLDEDLVMRGHDNAHSTILVDVVGANFGISSISWLRNVAASGVDYIGHLFVFPDNSAWLATDDDRYRGGNSGKCLRYKFSRAAWERIKHIPLGKIPAEANLPNDLRFQALVVDVNEALAEAKPSADLTMSAFVSGHYGFHTTFLTKRWNRGNSPYQGDADFIVDETTGNVYCPRFSKHLVMDLPKTGVLYYCLDMDLQKRIRAEPRFVSSTFIPGLVAKPDVSKLV